MILLQASHIQKQYNANQVLVDANLVIQNNDRVALLGPNGAGKSTLLRIVAEEEKADSGVVSIAKQIHLGYVAQFLDMDDNTSLFAFVAESFRKLLDMEQKLVQMERQMAEPDVYENATRFAQIASAYDNLRQQFTDANGYAVEARIRRVLDGLAFPSDVWQKPIKSLSGGQKTRLSLARLLAQEPDVLVLDEPTNYLDTETLSWLENYLRTYNGAILVVSHDRYFLDAICTAVYELHSGTTTRFEGNYSDYMGQKAQQIELETKRFEAQQEQITRMEEFVQKNLARASTTKRAQSRRKALERMTRLEKPDASVPQLAARFTAGRQTGKDVLTVRDLSVGYNSASPLCSGLNLQFRKGDRVAIVGPNGIGKTTFLKTVVGRLQALSGQVRWGANTDVGYYDQEQQDLNPAKTVLSQIHDEYPHLSITAVRTALGRFLFQGQAVEKPVAALSGGERSRLSLCRLMLRQPNVLMMDEPTNHLDLLAKEALEDALTDYDGTLIFVSHDRYFIDALATQVLRIDETGHHLYLGNYSDYVRKRSDDEQWEHEWKQNVQPAPSKNSSNLSNSSNLTGPAGTNARSIATTHDPGAADKVDGSLADDGASQRGSAQAPKGNGSKAKLAPVRSADLRKLETRVGKLEAEIEETETHQQDTSTKLVEASIAANVEEIQRLQQLLNELEERHGQLLEDWEDAAAQLEELRAQDAAYRNQQ